MALARCAKCIEDPVEQVRGEMRPEDYFDVHQNALRDPFHEPEDYREEIDDSNRSDMRIICPQCHRTTGWNKTDAPGAPGAIADYTRKCWNELVSKE